MTDYQKAIWERLSCSERAAMLDAAKSAGIDVVALLPTEATPKGQVRVLARAAA